MLALLADPQTPATVQTFNLYGVLPIISGLIIPAVVGLVTPASMPGIVKQLLLAVLALISTGLGLAIDAHTNGVPFLWQSFLLTGLLTIISSQMAHVAFWKKYGLDTALANIGVKDSGAAPKTGDAVAAPASDPVAESPAHVAEHRAP